MVIDIAVAAVAVGLFVSIVAYAVGIFRHGPFPCDELPLQRRRLTPDPPRVRLCPFDQDAT